MLFSLGRRQRSGGRPSQGYEESYPLQMREEHFPVAPRG